MLDATAGSPIELCPQHSKATWSFRETLATLVTVFRTNIAVGASKLHRLFVVVVSELWTTSLHLVGDCRPVCFSGSPSLWGKVNVDLYSTLSSTHLKRQRSLMQRSRAAASELLTHVTKSTRSSPTAEIARVGGHSAVQGHSRSLVFSERELTFTFAICYRPSVLLSSVVCL